MNAPAIIGINIPSLQMQEEELCRVLETTVYPGAKLESIKLVISVCKAAHLDPLQKPYHIVPMSVKKAGTKDQYEWRDVIMPGVGLYRTQAARTGQYAGVSEPEYGPTKTLTFGNASIDYPEWSRVTVRRTLSDGLLAEFTAKEFWTENYATAGRDTTAPNAMWKKRPFGQIGKCAEAQALRKAFPEIGAQPTAEELEGKTLDEGEGLTIDGATGQVQRTAVAGPQSKSAPKAEQPPATDHAQAKEPSGNAPAGGAAPSGEDPLLTEGERNHIKSKMESGSLTEVDLRAKFALGLADLHKSHFSPVKDWIKNPAA